MSPLSPFFRARPDSHSEAEEERRLLEGLRAGDQAAFATLLDRHGAAMLRVARMYVRDRAAAEEVVQETWLAVLQGIERFEGRSSVKTWLFRILANRAKTRGVREARSSPFSALAEAAEGEPAVEPERFHRRGHPEAGGWDAPPRPWETLPEERLLSQETLRLVSEAIEALPPTQREVIRLRDVEGWSAEEVCAALDLTDGNQRVLLHRARSRVRDALEDYLGAAA